MALKKEKKVEIVDELTGIVKDSQSMVFVSFNKLTVKDVNTLRRGLQVEDVKYKVAKKTLLKRALSNKDISGTMPELNGEIAVAYSTDLMAPARGVYNFQKVHKDTVSIVGGIFEGKYMNGVEMIAIATIPGREVLLSQIAYLLKSPMQRLAIGISEVAKKK